MKFTISWIMVTFICPINTSIKVIYMIECLTIPYIIGAPQIEGSFFIAGNNLLPCTTVYKSTYWVNECLKLTFDTKHDILWVMFKGHLPLTPHNYVWPTPNPAHFFW